MKFNDFSMILKHIWISMIFQELWEPCALSKPMLVKTQEKFSDLISLIWIEYIKLIRQMSDEPWKFFANTADFDALAQASDFRMARRPVAFLCLMQDLNPGSQTPNHKQTEHTADKLTELSRTMQKHELDSPSLWSASIQPTRPHCWLA